MGGRKQLASLGAAPLALCKQQRVVTHSATQPVGGCLCYALKQRRSHAAHGSKLGRTYASRTAAVEEQWSGMAAKPGMYSEWCELFCVKQRGVPVAQAGVAVPSLLARDARGSSALHYAARRGCSECVRVLCKAIDQLCFSSMQVAQSHAEAHAKLSPLQQSLLQRNLLGNDVLREARLGKDAQTIHVSFRTSCIPASTCKQANRALRCQGL
jgi:hypothetical protein